MTQEQIQDNYKRPLVITRYGKIVFSEEASQLLELTENAYIKVITDDTCSKYYIVISSNDNNASFKVKTSGIYSYISRVDILKALGLYSPDPSIYELIKVDELNGEVAYCLDKIITVKDPKIGKYFQYKDELRSVIAMLNAKI